MWPTKECAPSMCLTQVRTVRGQLQRICTLLVQKRTLCSEMSPISQNAVLKPRQNPFVGQPQQPNASVHITGIKTSESIRQLIALPFPLHRCCSSACPCSLAHKRRVSKLTVFVQVRVPAGSTHEQAVACMVRSRAAAGSGDSEVASSPSGAQEAGSSTAVAANTPNRTKFSSCC